MKNKFLMLLALLISTGAIAQNRSVSLGLDVGVGSTSLQNKDDKSLDDAIYKSSAKWNPNFGLDLRFTNPDSRVYSYGIGVQYMSYGNEYTSTEFEDAGIKYPIAANGELIISYISVPLHIEFGLTQSSRGQLYLGLAYIPHFLSDMSEKYTLNVTDGTSFEKREIEINKSEWKESYEYNFGVSQGQFSAKANLSEPIYNSTVHTMRLTLGYDLAINDNLNLNFHLDYLRGLSDMENKNKITFESTDDMGVTTSEDIEIYKQFDYKWIYNANGDNSRENTYLSNLGLGVGFYYNFGGGNGRPRGRSRGRGRRR